MVIFWSKKVRILLGKIYILPTKRWTPIRCVNFNVKSNIKFNKFSKWIAKLTVIGNCNCNWDCQCYKLERIRVWWIGKDFEFYLALHEKKVRLF